MRGRLTGIQLPFRAKFPVISFEVEADPEALEKYQGKDLEITVKQYRKKRSIDANACGAVWGSSQTPCIWTTGASTCSC